MKANELMLLDFVLLYGEPIKVTAMLLNTMVIDEDSKAVQPIPITNDILKANGCELVDVGDNGPGTPKKNINRFEKWQLSTKWNDIFIFFDRMLKNYSINAQYGVIRDLNNVHEMQHALRIFGLHEVADSFKLE